MFTTLPDFTPRDSHALWYTSSRNPLQHQIPGHHEFGHNDAGSSGHGGPGHARHHRAGHHLLESSPLARLAADEQLMNRRRANIQNFGSGWLKPPGVPKTLHQLREEKREQEEHQEALRREHLAQELAEAEADGVEGGEDGAMMDDVQLDGAQDLDDEVPDADEDDVFGAGDDDDEDEENDDTVGTTGHEFSGLHAGVASEDEDDEAQRAERANDLMTARMRMTDDAFREALVRGDPDGDDMYGASEELQEEDQGHMLSEEDFAPADSTGLDMDADLDDDVPEAESLGGYEHTDSDADLSSDAEGRGYDDEEEEGMEMSFGTRAAPMGPPLSPTMGARGRGRGSTGTRQSMDLSMVLSQDESSFMASSPAHRRARQG